MSTGVGDTGVTSRRLRRAIGVAAGLLTLGFVCAASASAATTRYADPAGSGGICTQLAPCTIFQAISGAISGDEVVVNPGDYGSPGSPLATEISIGNSIDVHGAAGQPRPVIYSTASRAVKVTDAGASVRYLQIERSGGSTVAGLVLSGATGSQLYVHSSTSRACTLDAGAVLRSSVCWASGAGQSGISVSADLTDAVTVRNVTAVGSGTGSFVYGIRVAADSGATYTMNATNVIASGPAADVRASGDTSSTAVVNLDHSNYDSEIESADGAAVTNPGTGTNLLAPPLFADAASGDFHQLAGSPTLDAGIDDGQLGPVDLDGDARSLDATLTCAAPVATPDVGADEFVAVDPDCLAPQTTISAGPKPKTTKTKARFTFSSSEGGSSFECKLDKGAFAPCTSPKSYRKLKPGKHTFQVRATDASSNLDATPAKRNWRIKKPRSR